MDDDDDDGGIAELRSRVALLYPPPRYEEALFGAGVRLLVAAPDPSVWRFSGICGEVVVVRDVQLQTCLLQIYDLNDLQLRFEYEVYENMEVTVSPWSDTLCTFEMDDFVAALQFADANQAAAFCDELAPLIPMPDAPDLAAIRALCLKSTGFGSRMKRLFSGGVTKNLGRKATPALAPTSASSSIPDAATGASGLVAARRASVSGYAAAATSVVDPTTRNIVGLSADGTLIPSQLPDAWVALLKKAGVRKSHLLDRRTSQMVLEIMGSKDLPAPDVTAATVASVPSSPPVPPDSGTATPSADDASAAAAAAVDTVVQGDAAAESAASPPASTVHPMLRDKRKSICLRREGVMASIAAGGVKLRPVKVPVVIPCVLGRSPPSRPSFVSTLLIALRAGGDSCSSRICRRRQRHEYVAAGQLRQQGPCTGGVLCACARAADRCGRLCSSCKQWRRGARTYSRMTHPTKKRGVTELLTVCCTDGRVLGPGVAADTEDGRGPFTGAVIVPMTCLTSPGQCRGGVISHAWSTPRSL
jgi:hypothetical protein